MPVRLCVCVCVCLQGFHMSPGRVSEAVMEASKTSAAVSHRLLWPFSVSEVCGCPDARIADSKGISREGSAASHMHESPSEDSQAPDAFPCACFIIVCVVFMAVLITPRVLETCFTLSIHVTTASRLVRHHLSFSHPDSGRYTSC